MLSFDVNVFGALELFGFEFLITETTVNTWIVMGLLILFAVIVRIKSSSWNPSDKPKGLQNLVEMMVDGWEGFYGSNANKTVMYLAPWFFALFAFLFVSNVIGVTGLRPPTADWGMTFPLALSTFFLIQFAGIRHRAKSYLRGIFLEPVFVFAPLNVIGELARPISLSFRLFGNILGGMILMSLLYAVPIVNIAIPVPLHIFFDIAVGALQAVIFTMLSLTFVSLAAED
ncbi:MAG: F0F1 ATP synthase subunit A [Defluviitaleaceae bacterium]|nr:F0F1 ATP synthase subunit A [Defluviitaleaceae bacterium]MCL2262029.1 F0F1 ATP synthase subunit A [Defluviitaleaceae bacterium]